MQDSHATDQHGDDHASDDRPDTGTPELPRRTPGVIPIMGARKPPPTPQILARVLDGLRQLPS